MYVIHANSDYGENLVHLLYTSVGSCQTQTLTPNLYVDVHFNLNFLIFLLISSRNDLVHSLPCLRQQGSNEQLA